MTVNIVSLKILLEMVFVMMKLIFTVAILMMAIVVETLLILAIVYNANAGVCLEFALGAIHKRRLLRGGGRGAPSKQMKGDEKRYLVLGIADVIYGFSMV